MGRHSVTQIESPLVVVTESDSRAPHTEVVASMHGTAYFFPWCGGASNIKDKNLLRYESVDKAEQAGYKLAKNCKGIK